MDRNTAFLARIKEVDQTFEKVYQTKEELIYDYTIEATINSHTINDFKKHFDTLSKKDQKVIRMDIEHLEKEISNAKQIIKHLHQIK
jgi:hypothetical protein